MIDYETITQVDQIITRGKPSRVSFRFRDRPVLFRNSSKIAGEAQLNPSRLKFVAVGNRSQWYHSAGSPADSANDGIASMTVRPICQAAGNRCDLNEKHQTSAMGCCLLRRDPIFSAPAQLGYGPFRCANICLSIASARSLTSACLRPTLSTLIKRFPLTNLTAVCVAPLPANAMCPT